MNKYTDEQIKFIKQLREDGNDWKTIALKYNETYLPENPKNNDSIRKVFSKYENIDFTDESFIKNQKDIFSLKKRNSLIAKENKIILDEVTNIENIKESFELLLDRIDVKFHKPIKIKKENKKINRTIIAHLSDTHYGNIIFKKEMGGTNEYNGTIAARRTALFFKNISEYKLQYRGETNLVIILNGDLCAGVIHDQEHAVDLMTEQFHTVLSIIGQGISYLAQNFNKITVYCNSDNHMRFMHKMSKERARVFKWDSFATMAYISLQREFKKYKNVEFIIPESPYAAFSVFNHRVFATHGDSVFTVGNPSNIVKMGSISSQIDKINNSDLSKNGKFGLFFIAHVHMPVISLLDNGAHVFINGCLSGLDAYGQSIGIFGNQPTQQFVEVTEKHIGDCRIVSLKEADSDKTLDKIIEFNDECFLD